MHLPWVPAQGSNSSSDDPGEDHYFEETGQAIAPEFYDYWSSLGLDFGDDGVSFRESLALFSYPIFPPQAELLELRTEPTPPEAELTVLAGGSAMGF